MGTGLPCLTALELERGKLTAQIMGLAHKVEARPYPALNVATAQGEARQLVE